MSIENLDYDTLILKLDLGESTIPPPINLTFSVNLNELSDSTSKKLYEELIKEVSNPNAKTSSLAKTCLGKLLIGRYNNTSLGIDWLIKAASENEPIAQHILGGWYLNTENTEYDMNKAFFWLEKSAELGYVKSMAMVGNILLIGYDGVQQNINKGIEWLENASLKGHAESQYNLAEYFYEANEMEKALYYYSLAAQKCYSRSQLIIAVMYRDGVGTQKDINKAYDYFFEATKNDDHVVSTIAKREIGMLYSTEVNNLPEAIPWWEAAATDGDSSCQFNLAILYAFGDDVVAINVNKAEMWLNKLEQQQEIPVSQEEIFNIKKQIMALKLRG